MSRPLLEIQNITKTYHAGNRIVHALDDVSITIQEQEIISLLGVNGAGKTTLSSIVATLHPPTSGNIIMNGKSIYQDINAYRHIVGFCPQKSNLNTDLSVEQILTFTGNYYGLPKEVITQRRETLIRQYGLEKYRAAKPSVLSGGYAHRVLLARSLMHNPKLLILDEPTVGLDPHIRRQLWAHIKELKKNGVSVLLTTHYLDEADELSDRVCILDAGKIKLISSPAALK
ncbi:ABC transporter ATP-binding protein [Methylicorpusculum sp.]|uniref:ABC transporter ATP-binding protein n=1 Tax=Methylicorpusculum sp. TaxID=2713644 RepID=UPI002ABD020D|nr:ABC transporter ATP-binding protein [Methylicorpusculum sp.]MDZ4151493.1 ABC transporter ATP-binding protein [Methylicorpusculum sp.]